MKQQDKLPSIFSFFGPPGSGKGTLAQKLFQKYKFQVLSTGNLCREHVTKGTVLGKKLDQYLKQGLLIPDDIVTDMVIDWLVTSAQPETPIILDGFPRTQGQAKQFLDFLRNFSKQYCFRVILIELPEDEIIWRLSKRLLCSNKKCQAPFAEIDKLTHCKFCDSVLIKRDDDREDVVRERLKSYPIYRDALFAYYKEIGQSIEILDIRNMNADQVFDRFVQQI